MLYFAFSLNLNIGNNFSTEIFSSIIISITTVYASQDMP